MISVVLAFEQTGHLFLGYAFPVCHITYRTGKVVFQFFLGDTAQGFIAYVHADVGRLVETAEHAYLRELGNSGEQDELQVIVRSLEYRIESFQHFPVPVLQQHFLLFSLNARIEYVQDRLVVFVNQHHTTSTRLFMGLFEQVSKAVSHIRQISAFPVLGFPTGNVSFQFLFHRSRNGEVASVEVDVKHGIFFPLRFQLLDGKPLEQLFPT